MKLRDFVFLLLLLNLPFSCFAAYKDCNYWKGNSDKSSKKVYDVSFQIIESLISYIPIVGDAYGTVTPILRTISGLRNEDHVDYKKIVNCYLHQYQRGRTHTTILNQDKQRLGALKSKNYQKLEDIRYLNLELNIEKELSSADGEFQAAVYPILPYWASVHLHVYKDLINMTGSGSLRYKLKHDEWVVFYATLILRYWRPYRKVLIRESYRSKPWRSLPEIFENPAERLLSNFTSIAYTTESKNKISRLLESCKVKKGSRVMFNALEWNNPPGIDWISCWGSGSRCQYRKCPSGYMDLNESPFDYNSKYAHGIGCRGEAFWIYSNYDQIMDGGIVNIKYSTKNNRGYWLSTNSFGDYLFSPSRTCPGKYFTRIQSGCDRENFKITKKRTSSSQKAVYDGNLIRLCRQGTKYYWQLHDIYKDGSETLQTKLERFFPPSSYNWNQHLEETMSCIHRFKNQAGAGGHCGRKIKLSGGVNSGEGNVLLWDSTRNKYMPVCDDGWSMNNAMVVCKMLGYSSGTHKVKSYFGKEGVDFIIDDVKCLGTERNILDCPHNTNENCGEPESAGVKCTP